MDGSENTVKQGLLAGQILHGSWGYNMTHAEFFMVQNDAAPGQFVKLLPLATVETSTGYLCGTALPALPPQGKGKVIKRRVRDNGSVKIKSYYGAAPWTGHAKYFNYCD